MLGRSGRGAPVQGGENAIERTGQDLCRERIGGGLYGALELKAYAGEEPAGAAWVVVVLEMLRHPQSLTRDAAQGGAMGTFTRGEPIGGEHPIGDAQRNLRRAGLGHLRQVLQRLGDAGEIICCPMCCSSHASTSLLGHGRRML